MTKFFRWADGSLHDLDLRSAATIDLELYGKMCAQREPAADLRPIPGEITREELMTLLFLLAEEWSGKGSVLELGPLFGSSTQAIGLGMASNPNLSSSCHFVADWFGLYYPPEDFRERLEPFLSGNPEWSAILADYEKEGFERAFKLLHEGQVYSSRLRVRRVTIPVRLGDSDEELRSLMRESAPCGFVFVDCAKYWRSVRSLASLMFERLLPGSLIAWQDFRWFNSYAIPVFTSLFSQHFSQLAIVGNMQVYEYLGGISEQAVLERFPATPGELGLNVIEPILRSYSDNSYIRGDAYGVLSSGLQVAFARADCGEMERARSLLSMLRNVPGFDTHQLLFDLAEGDLGAEEHLGVRGVEARE